MSSLRTERKPKTRTTADRKARAARGASSPRPKVLGLRAAQKQLTRDLLLKTATALFTESGYATVTVDDIAAGAGTTRTTFYQYFKSKGELTQALIVEVNTLLTSADETPLSEVVAIGAEAVIREWLTRKVDQWAQIQPYVQIAHQAAAIEPEIEAAVLQWFESAIGDIVGGLDAADRFEPPSRKVRATLAFGQLEFASRRWMHFGWDVDRDQTIQTLTESWQHLLSDPEVSRSPEPRAGRRKTVP